VQNRFERYASPRTYSRRRQERKDVSDARTCAARAASCSAKPSTTPPRSQTFRWQKTLLTFCVNRLTSISRLCPCYTMQGASTLSGRLADLCKLVAQTHERSCATFPVHNNCLMVSFGRLACGFWTFYRPQLIVVRLSGTVGCGIAGGLLGPRTYSADRHCLARSSVSLRHCVFGGAVYVAGKPRHSVFWCGTLCSVARCMASPCTSS